MKVVFLGVGEAFDENYPNNSSLILSNETSLMIDCGDAAVRQLWNYIIKNKLDFNFPDAIYITHRHSDHLFGLPALLSRMHEEKRTKSFTIICTKQLREDIINIANYAYQGTATNFPFKLNFIDIEPGKTIDFNDLKLSCAHTYHSVPNMAIKISDNRNNICYSGDGPFNDKAVELYKNSDLVVHEAYLYDKRIIGHECITEIIGMARKNSIKSIAFVHLNKHFRKNDASLIKERIDNENKEGKVKFLLPIPMDELDLG